MNAFPSWTAPGCPARRIGDPRSVVFLEWQTQGALGNIMSARLLRTIARDPVISWSSRVAASRRTAVEAFLLPTVNPSALNSYHLSGRPSSTVMAKPSSNGEQKVVGEKEELAKAPWLKLVNVKYTRGGQERSWQYCERTTRTTSGDVDAVCIFAIVRNAGQHDKVIIVKQFRPPLNSYTVELVAGLVDEGETPEEAALRELKEETGYSGQVLFVGGKQYLSPGLTNECVRTVFIEIDQESKVEQDAEDAGFIKVGMLPLDDLMGSLERLEAEGFAIWVGLYSIAQTLKLQSILKGAT